MARFLKTVTVAALAATAGAGAGAAQGQRGTAVTSAYTDLDLDRCRELRHVKEGASTEWRCPGYRGIPLWVAIGDERFDIDAPANNGSFETTSRFNALGPRAEWRLRGGKPFAIIYRLRLMGETDAQRSMLGVEGIGQGRRAGCLIAWVGGATPNANEAAREQADRYAADFRCGRDHVRRIGEPG